MCYIYTIYETALSSADVRVRVHVQNAQINAKMARHTCVKTKVPCTFLLPPEFIFIDLFIVFFFQLWCTTCTSIAK